MGLPRVRHCGADTLRLTRRSRGRAASRLALGRKPATRAIRRRLFGPILLLSAGIRPSQFNRSVLSPGILALLLLSCDRCAVCIACPASAAAHLRGGLALCHSAGNPSRFNRLYSDKSAAKTAQPNPRAGATRGRKVSVGAPSLKQMNKDVATRKPLLGTASVVVGCSDDYRRWAVYWGNGGNRRGLDAQRLWRPALRVRVL